MVSNKLEIMGKLLGLNGEEIEKAIPVKEKDILCLCRVEGDRIIQTHVKLKRIAKKGKTIGAIGKCLNCGKVYYL